MKPAWRSHQPCCGWDQGQPSACATWAMAQRLKMLRV